MQAGEAVKDREWWAMLLVLFLAVVTLMLHVAKVILLAWSK
jgi:hypothetical protein